MLSASCGYIRHYVRDLTISGRRHTMKHASLRTNPKMLVVLAFKPTIFFFASELPLHIPDSSDTPHDVWKSPALDTRTEGDPKSSAICSKQVSPFTALKRGARRQGQKLRRSSPTGFRSVAKGMRYRQCFILTNAAAPQAAHERDAAVDGTGDGARGNRTRASRG